MCVCMCKSVSFVSFLTENIFKPVSAVLLKKIKFKFSTVACSFYERLKECVKVGEKP